MTRTQYLAARIAQIQTALLARTPGVRSTTLRDGSTVVYADLEAELQRLEAELARRQSGGIRNFDLGRTF